MQLGALAGSIGWGRLAGKTSHHGMPRPSPFSRVSERRSVLWCV
jgi:hypothetical protein